MRWRRPTAIGAGLLALVLGLLLAGFSGAARADEASELLRTVEGAWVFAPATGAAGYSRLTVADLSGYPSGAAPKPLAVILYAHGCDGLSEISAASGRFLAQAGYLVVEPDSFARAAKPASCEPAQHLGGLHRAVLGWRQKELRYAARKLRAADRCATFRSSSWDIRKARSPPQLLRMCQPPAGSSRDGPATPAGPNIAVSPRLPGSRFWRSSAKTTRGSVSRS